MSKIAPPAISRRVAVILVFVSALSLLSFLVLSAYAPELRNDTAGRADVLSKSAIGYAGWRFLAEQTKLSPVTWRSPLRPKSDNSLLVLMPETLSSPGAVKSLSASGVSLIVLPKWNTAADPGHPGWVRKIAPWGNDAAGPLASFGKDIKLNQAEKTAPVRLSSKDALFQAILPDADVTIDSLQTISGKNIMPDIVDGGGNAVLAHIAGSQTYILADPDFVNNQSLDDARIARFALGLLTNLGPQTYYTIAFDLTLNGFGQSPGMLRAAFAPPFLGATLSALLAALFIAYHAFFRFGGVHRPDRVLAFGKRALADNTAAFIHLMHREPRMGLRYALAMVHSLAAHKGIAADKQSETAWIEALEKHAASPSRYRDLEGESAEVRSTHELLTVAEKIYSWRRGLLNEHR